MADENEPTNELKAPGNDPETPDTAPLFKQAIEEMQQTRKVLTDQGAQVLERLDRFETEIRRELRTLGNRLDLVVIEISKIQAQGRDLEQRVTELEQKPA